MLFDERDILLKAAGIVDEMWCQYRTYMYGEGDKIVGVCAWGALMLVEEILDVSHEASQEAYRIFSEHVGGNIIGWNDTPGRTADEVSAAMREVAYGNLG